MTAILAKIDMNLLIQHGALILTCVRTFKREKEASVGVRYLHKSM